MKLDDRIRAAAFQLYGPSVDPSGGRPYVQIRNTKRALKAAFPELFTDPPTAWIAPWEAGPVMLEAAYYDGYTQKIIGPQETVWNASKTYEVFRDSHLSTLKGEKGDG